MLTAPREGLIDALSALSRAGVPAPPRLPATLARFGEHWWGTTPCTLDDLTEPANLAAQALHTNRDQTYLSLAIGDGWFGAEHITWVSLAGALSVAVRLPWPSDGDPTDRELRVARTWAMLRTALDLAATQSAPARFYVVIDEVSGQLTTAAGDLGPRDHPSVKALGAHLERHVVPYLARLPKVRTDQAGTLTWDVTSAQQAALGDAGPWVGYLPWAWRASVDQRTAGHPVPLSPQRPHYGVEAAASTLSPLLHLLTYALGWSRPDVGLLRWQQAGRPVDNPVLALVERWWGERSVEELVTFARQSHVFARSTGPQFAAMTGMTGFDPTELSLPPAAPMVGSAAPEGAHLHVHLFAPLEDPSHSPAGPPVVRVSPVWDDNGTPRATLRTNTYHGWYRELLAADLPATIGGRGLRVDVTCTPVGHLGTFRRSTRTGLWFRGRHHVHLLGNPF